MRRERVSKLASWRWEKYPSALTRWLLFIYFFIHLFIHSFIYSFKLLTQSRMNESHSFDHIPIRF